MAQVGTIKVRVSQYCPDPGGHFEWQYGSVEQAIKDTIPGEWGPPLSPITFESLEAAAVMIRSRIMWNDLHPMGATYDYITADIDHLAGETMPPGCDATYTMNTVLNGARHSGQSYYPYNSNGATDATAGRYIVDTSGAVLAAGFNSTVQARSVSCTEQSADWEFCAISSLADAEFSAGNPRAARLDNKPADLIEFQVEAFRDRVHPVNGHYWYRYTYAQHAGWTGLGYMQAVPDDDTRYSSTEGYSYNSPQLKYKVAFPTAADNVRWYVWVRGRGCNGDNDSLHIGLDDLTVSSAEDMTGWDSCSWIWSSLRMNGSNSYVTTSFSPRQSTFHTLNLWMREDGMRADKIILTTRSPSQWQP